MQTTRDDSTAPLIVLPSFSPHSLKSVFSSRHREHLFHVPVVCVVNLHFPLSATLSRTNTPSVSSIIPAWGTSNFNPITLWFAQAGKLSEIAFNGKASLPFPCPFPSSRSPPLTPIVCLLVYSFCLFFSFFLPAIVVVRGDHSTERKLYYSGCR